MMIDSLYTDKVQLLNEALNTATKMAVIADSLQALSNKAEAYKRLYKVNYRIGNTKNALDFAIKYITVKDSLMSENKQKIITDLQTKYETYKKEQKIITLNQEQIEQVLGYPRKVGRFVS